MTPREKYYTDPSYRVLVDTMLNQIIRANFTPGEMREAAVLASIMYEESRVTPNAYIINNELENQLRNVNNILDKLYNGNKNE